MREDDAVSEAIGFIIIFSLMVTAIGIVTLYGYPVLLSQQSATYEKTMEQNLLVLQHDVRTLAREMVPYRETTMQVGGGVLSFMDTPDAGRVVVEIGDEELVNRSPGGLEYRSDDGEYAVALSNGAVMLRPLTGDGSSMIGSPRWFCDERTGTLVITVIVLTEKEPVSFSGMGTIELSQASTGTNTTERTGISQPVTVTCTGPYRTAWKTCLTTELGFSPVDEDTWRKSGVQRLVIRLQEVSVGRG